MMPNMREAFRGLTLRKSFQIMRSQVVDHEAVNTEVVEQRVSIFMMPMPARKISVKPEGERAWKWWEAHSTTRLELGWVLFDDMDGKRFKVMADSDFSQAGFYAYELTETPA